MLRILKTRIKLQLLLLLIIAFSTSAQDLRTSEAKNAFLYSGKEIKKGTALLRTDKVVIKRKGRLFLMYKDSWGIFLSEGIYSIDSVLNIEFNKPSFKRHDSVFTVLKNRDLQNCKFPGAMIGSVRVNTIDLLNEPALKIAADSALIEWQYPIPYSGKSFLVIKTLFDDYLDLKETIDNQVMLDLTPYSRESAIIFLIVAENCRKSRDIAIIMTKKK